MKLTLLAIGGTKVSDLSPLKGNAADVPELSAARKSPTCRRSRDMPLKNLSCDFKPERDTELLRSIKTLETINDKPAAEFWKEVERARRVGGTERISGRMPNVF